MTAEVQRMADASEAGAAVAAATVKACADRYHGEGGDGGPAAAGLPRATRASVHLNFARGYMAIGSFAAAAAECGASLALSPGLADAHGTLSDALRELGRLPEARAAAQEAARLNPAAWRAHAKAMYRRA